MPTLDEMMERQRAKLALRELARQQRGGLGSSDLDFLNDPRALKLPIGTLHKLMVKNMGRVYEMPPREHKNRRTHRAYI